MEAVVGRVDEELLWRRRVVLLLVIEELLWRRRDVLLLVYHHPRDRFHNLPKTVCGVPSARAVFPLPATSVPGLDEGWESRRHSLLP